MDGVDFTPTLEELKALKLMGFVYIIVQNSTNKAYIGKKGFWSHRKLKPTDKRRSTVESDWREYASSNSELSKLVKEAPEDFSRHILYLCSTKYGMSYHEDRLLYAFNVLEQPERFWNDNIAGKYFTSKFNQWYRPARAGAYPSGFALPWEPGTVGSQTPLPLPQTP